MKKGRQNYKLIQKIEQDIHNEIWKIDYSKEIRNQKGINPPAYLKALPRLPETIGTGRETAKKQRQVERQQRNRDR